MKTYNAGGNPVTIPILMAALVFVFVASCHKAHPATPTPSPFDVNAVDTSLISEMDIQATIAHRNALHEMLIQQTLPAASDDVKEAVAKAQDLQKQIDALALSAAKVPVLQAELDKAHKAIWRDVFMCLGAGFVIGLLGPKLLGLASMVGV